MNDFERCNKLTGVYWLKEPLDKLKINITLKPPADIISLPKFEDYTNDSSNISLQQNIEEFSFDWQEKRFSEWEVQRYKDVHNCLTETELGYHELVKSNEVVPSKVFTYIHEDYYTPLPQEKKRSESLVASWLERVNVWSALGSARAGRDPAAGLLRGPGRRRDQDDPWTAMHVLLDCSDYNDREGLLVKREAVLLSLFHDGARGCLTASPDVNQLASNPYAAGPRAPLYAVSLHLGGARGPSGDLHSLLLKLHKKWQKKHKQLASFAAPPLGSARYCLTLEIVSAHGFQDDQLYVEYHIKEADGARCEGERRGRTHLSEASERDGASVCHFGHLIELCLEIDSEIAPGPLRVYLEAVAPAPRPSGGRHRSSGYAHALLPLGAGSGSLRLRCVRPDEPGADERRFFLGGCHLIEDLEALSRPELQNGDYTYTETGSILLRTSVIIQQSVPGGAGSGAWSETEPAVAAAADGAGAAALLLGAEAALRKYRRARARLAEASGGAGG